MTANLHRYVRSIILAFSGASIHDNTHSLYLQQSSHQKARLLRIVQSNCTWDGLTPRSIYKKPFDLLAKGLSSENWLTVADEIRNFCVTSQLEELEQIEEALAFAS